MAGPNYGLLTNMANGLHEGLIDYMTISNARRQQQREDLINGIQDTPNGPQFTAEKQTEIEQNNQLGKLKRQQEMAEYDPTSATSQSYGGLLKQKLGYEAPEGLSAHELKGYVQPLESSSKLQSAQQIAEMKAQNAQDLAMQRQQNSLDKKSAVSSKDWSSFNDALNPNKARGGNLAKAQSAVMAAERIEGLKAQAPDGNLNKNQIAELISAHAALINGGSPFAAQIQEMMPESARGSTEDMISWLTNKPRGREQQQFVNQLFKSSEREKEIAQSQVHRAQGENLAGFEHLYTADPDRYKRMIKARHFTPEEIDEYGNYKGESNGALQYPAGQGGGLLSAPATPSGGGGQAQDPQIAAYAEKNGLDYQTAVNIINARRNSANASK